MEWTIHAVRSVSRKFPLSICSPLCHSWFNTGCVLITSSTLVCSICYIEAERWLCKNYFVHNLLSLEFSQSVIYKQMLHFMSPLHPSFSWRFVFNSIWDLATDHKKHNTTLQQSYNYQLIEHISATDKIKSNFLLSHKTPTAKTKPVH